MRWVKDTGASGLKLDLSLRKQSRKWVSLATLSHAHSVWATAWFTDQATTAAPKPTAPTSVHFLLILSILFQTSPSCGSCMEGLTSHQERRALLIAGAGKSHHTVLRPSWLRCTDAAVPLFKDDYSSQQLSWEPLNYRYPTWEGWDRSPAQLIPTWACLIPALRHSNSESWSHVVKQKLNQSTLHYIVPANKAPILPCNEIKQ